MAPFEIAKRNTFLIDPSGKIVKVWTGVDPATQAMKFSPHWQPSNRKACKNGRMSQVSDQFSKGCADIRAALVAFPAAAANTSYRPGGWTRKQVLGHMVDSAANNHQRFVRAALEGHYSGPGYQQEGWVRFTATPSCHGRRCWRCGPVLTDASRVVARIPEECFAAMCVVGEGDPVRCNS